MGAVFAHVRLLRRNPTRTSRLHLKGITMILAARLANDQSVMTAWSVIASPELCGILAEQGFDAVTVDMQHGGHTEETAFRSAFQISHAGKPALLRIPVGRFDLASRALDQGFEAVIAPMINSASDARAFADAMKYPPLGERSWGLGQALQIHREHTAASYFKAANRQTLAIAMIETRAALGVLDDILAIGGIDAVFVGPSDLSISWLNGEGIDPDLPAMQTTMADVARRARAAGKHAATFAVDPSRARAYTAMGYSLTALFTDAAVVKAGSEVFLALARD